MLLDQFDAGMVDAMDRCLLDLFPHPQDNGSFDSKLLRLAIH